MGLWGSNANAESRPKFLREDTNAKGAGGSRSDCIARPGGWALQSGTAASGNDNADAQPEVLVCIKNLSNKFANANILSATYTAGAYADSATFDITLQFDESVTVTSATRTANQTITNKLYVLLDRLGGTDMASDNTIACQYFSGSGTNKLVFRGVLQSADAGFIGFSNTMLNFDGTAAAVDADGHDIRTFRLNGTDSDGSNVNDRIVLDGTDGSSTNAGDALMCEQVSLLLEGPDHASSVLEQTLTGQDSENASMLEDGSSQGTTEGTTGGRLIMDTAANEGDPIVLEDKLGTLVTYTQVGSSSGSASVLTGVTTT